MIRNYLLLFVFFSFSVLVKGQLKNVFVETYYISDANDAANEDGGKLPLGATTYRIYVELNKGSKLLKLYGDENHLLKFSSTEDVFNHNSDGASLAFDINRNRLKENTVALDSWLTLGQVSKAGADVQFGIPKRLDKNGSALSIGIGNNLDNLLKNNDSKIGVPLTVADGLIPNSNKPSEWLSQGFIDPSTNEETSIFGASVKGKTFESKNAFIRNSGSQGILADTNQVLIGQITTTGTLSFELNIEVLTSDNKIIKFVADASKLQNDEIFSPLLKYPLECGCQDPDFLEFDPKFACNDVSKCKTKIIFGCMDPQACNYNSKANFNLESLCCYIGYCNDISLEVICPLLPPRTSENELKMEVYPNPAVDYINIIHNLKTDKKSKVEIYNLLGQLVFSESLTPDLHKISNFSTFYKGTYSIQISNENETIRKKIIKLN